MKTVLALFSGLFAVGGALAASPAPQWRMQQPQYQDYKQNHLQRTASTSNMTTDQRLARLERILESQALLELSRQLEQLQRELSELRGQVEQLTFSNKQISEQQRNTYLDLDSRIQHIQEQLAGGATPGGPAGQPPGNNAATPPKPAFDPEQARKDYSTAVGLIKSKQYAAAISSLQKFVNSYPQSKYAGKAQFWLGELNYVKRNYKVAVSEYGKVVANYPKSAKIADAYLKQGYCYYELKQWDQAKKNLNVVVAKYPRTTAARLAKQRLNQIRREKH